MRENIKKIFSIIVLVTMLTTYPNHLIAKAWVTCGGSDDGHRCHYRSTVGTPPPMYHTFGDKIMNYGVGSYGSNTRYYWIGSNLPSRYTSPIDTAYDEWVYTTNSIGITTSISIHKTNTRSSAYFEMIDDDTLPYKVLGKTEHYINSTLIGITSGTLNSNYGWTQIHINSNYIDYMGYGTTKIQSVSSHEIGHGMGLSHQNCRTSSVMCQTEHGRTANRADSIDLQTINHLWAHLKTPSKQEHKRHGTKKAIFIPKRSKYRLK